MIANTPSRTALGVAMHRAAHQVLDTPRVLDDPMALAIVGADRNPRIRAEMLRRERGVTAPFIRAFMAARSRLAEDELEAAIGRGIRQYVVLGAGLDTFAYRQPASAAGLSIFEIDHPDTQAWKLEKLREAQVAVPANVIHVPADLSRRTLRETLAEAGVGLGQPAFFAWLGVSMYLERDAVMATLADIRAAAIGGGGVVFDYIADPVGLPVTRRAVFDRYAEGVRRLGEPWISFFVSDALVTDLRGLGFTSVSDIDGGELNRRYFAGRADGLRVAGLSHLVRASA
jgi:methyltransferase (TIGR00027 family)